MTTARLQLPEIATAQAGKEQTHNAALAVVDALVSPAVESMALATPPGSPAEGALYIPAAGATDAWSGHDGEIAQFHNAAWAFHVPWDGLQVWSVADQVYMRWSEGGGAWVSTAAAGDFLADGSVPMAGALQMAGNEIRQGALRDTREVLVIDAAASGAVDLDLAAGNAFALTLAGGITLSIINEPAAGVAAAITLLLAQDVTGGHSVSWPAGLRWPGGSAPTLSTAGGAVDLVALVRLDGDWYGMVAGLGFA